MEFIPGKVARNHHMRESERVTFIRNYIEKRREIDGNEEPVTDADVGAFLGFDQTS